MPRSSQKPPIVELPTSLAGWLAYIEAQHPKSIAMGLDRVNEVRQRLDLNPDFPVVTVAGTNGKGSTCAMLEHIYHEAGYRVGCYSSPHLLFYNERVRIDCKDASDAELCAAFLAVERAREGVLLTYFEFGTLAAVWHFMQSAIEVAILEVGLGGRLDAVNAFEPSCSIVTSIDLDHMDFLGHTREDIGHEKSGIFRRNVAAICGDIDPPFSLLNHAASIGSDLKLIRRDFSITANHGNWTYQAGDVDIPDLPLPALTGSFQLNNAACAMTAINVLQARLPVTRVQMVAGLRKVRLAGRFQQLSDHPKVILDVAHNPHAARVLAENLLQEACEGGTFAVFAMLADKDIEGVVAAVADQIDSWYVGDIDNVRAASVKQLVHAINLQGTDKAVRTFEGIASAYRQAFLDAGKNDRIIVFGSFFTVADVMRFLASIHRND